MTKAIDLSDQVFGRLEVVSRAESTKRGTRWLVRCSCKAKTELVVATSNLRSGNTKSCGCLHKEQLVQKVKKHGRSRTSIYAIWSVMIQRCQNSNNKDFGHYGGRGITVCDRWLRFEHFLADIGERPENATLERRDNDQGYCPGNCYWATRETQSRNKRNNRKLTLNGVTRLLIDWAEEKNLAPVTIRDRLRKGWSVKRALNTPGYRQIEDRRKWIEQS